MAKKELACTSFQVPSLTEELKIALQEEMDGLTIQVDRAKIPSGGGLAFELPGDDPDNPDLAKEIVGVIIDHYPVNSYWPEKYTGQNTMPDCFSMDGHVGQGNPGGSCEACPLNQFGSASDGDGKACKNGRAIYILRKDHVLPILLMLPPTSIRSFSNFLVKQVLTKGLRSNGVVTRVTLKKATNAGGIVYSQAQFSVAEVLSEKAIAVLLLMAEQMKPITRRQWVEDALPVVDAETGEVL